MKNKLSDLNNYLFEQLERLNDDDLSDDQLEKEIDKSQAVTKVAETIIANGNLSLKMLRHMDEYGYERDKSGVPFMLGE